MLPLPVEQSPELIFGLVAPIGVDLDVISDLLTEALREVRYSATIIRLTKLIPVSLSSTQTESGGHIASYQSRISSANLVRASVGDHALAALAVSAIRTFRKQKWEENSEIPLDNGGSRKSIEPEEIPLHAQAYILRQLKRPEEVSVLRQVYGKQFILISAYAPQEWRVRRLAGREKESVGGLISETDAQNKARSLVLQDANEGQDVHGQNVRDAFPLGDVFVDATSRLSCEVSLRRFIQLLFGSNEITPTHDEYGMYLAKSAALRSADLSRQVGAAIFRPSGEILTLGCNEVPKAGGGTYWAGDEFDSRDFVQGGDPNDTRKMQVLVDVIDRLVSAGHLSQALQRISDPNEISKLLLRERGVGSLRESKLMDLLEFGRIVHAEMCALSDASRKGLSVENATLYCTAFPCHLCAKLIVASGITKVIYLEPYPKSYASDLHGDAIATEVDKPNRKVSFNSFIGVSPFRYRDLFERRKRKDASGSAQRWSSGERRPLIEVLYPSYFMAEAHVVGTLTPALPSLA